MKSCSHAAHFLAPAGRVAWCNTLAKEQVVSVWLALASVAAVSALPLLGLLVLAADAEHVERAVRPTISFAVGALLGGALLHLFPAALADLGPGPGASLGFLAGFLGFFILERFLWAHSHSVRRTAPQVRPVAVLNLVGDGLHNLLDGMVIAASYTQSPQLGIATTLAVVLHEVPQELGDLGVLLHAGLPVRRAVLWNVFSGATALAGATLVLLVGSRVAGAVVGLLAIAAGGFVYIAASDLVPELRRVRGRRASVTQTLLILLGIAVMTIPALLE
jgi:zinc and cadmium transporter